MSNDTFESIPRDTLEQAQGGWDRKSPWQHEQTPLINNPNAPHPWSDKAGSPAA